MSLPEKSPQEWSSRTANGERRARGLEPREAWGCGGVGAWRDGEPLALASGSPASRERKLPEENAKRVYRLSPGSKPGARRTKINSSALETPNLC